MFLCVCEAFKAPLPADDVDKALTLSASFLSYLSMAGMLCDSFA